VASDHLAKTETAVIGGGNGYIAVEQCSYIFTDTVVVSMSCEVIDGTTGGTYCSHQNSCSQWKKRIPTPVSV
jgi:hypothetical protein